MQRWTTFFELLFDNNPQPSLKFLLQQQQQICNRPYDALFQDILQNWRSAVGSTADIPTLANILKTNGWVNVAGWSQTRFS